MERPIAIIEINDSDVRMLIGNVINDKPYVVYTTSRPCAGLVSRTDIIDENKLIQIVSSLAHIKSEEAHMLLTVSDATIILPPSGFQVFKCDKTTNLVSSSGIIQDVDIRNVISMVSREIAPQGSQIVDIIPETFITNQGKRYSEPPIGEITNQLGIHAIVHTLPMKTVISYSELFRLAHIRPKRLLIAPYCISEYVKRIDNMPKNYILLDMNVGYSSITLVNNYSPIRSGYFLYGFNDLVLSTSEQFAVSEDVAKELLRKYGYSKRDVGFKPCIVKSTNEYGEEIDFTQDDLNAVISKFMTSYFSQFDATYGSVLEGCVAEVKKLPLILTGELLTVDGIFKIVENKYSEPESIISLSSDVIGARGFNNVALIGALLINSKFKGSLSEDQQKVSQLTRDEKEDN